MVRFFADDEGVDAGNFDRGRFCDAFGCGEGVFGSAAAFAALLEALVRPFDVVEYLGTMDAHFYTSSSSSCCPPPSSRILRVGLGASGEVM